MIESYWDCNRRQRSLYLGLKLMARKFSNISSRLLFSFSRQIRILLDQNTFHLHNLTYGSQKNLFLSTRLLTSGLATNASINLPTLPLSETAISFQHYLKLHLFSLFTPNHLIRAFLPSAIFLNQKYNFHS